MSLPAAKLALAVRRARTQSGAAELLNSDPIAIIGMGCRLPGKVDSPESFWTLLQNGVDAIVDLPRGRWGSAAQVPKCQGGFLDEVTGFDAEFFGIPPRESDHLDPQHRLLMEVVWESLWNARLQPEALAGSRSGVFVAVYNNDYYRLQFSHAGNINAYTSSGTSHSTAVGRISFLLDWKGPSIAIDTACSSSLVAIHLACQSLRAGECQMAVAGGVSLILAPEEIISLTKLGMLASDWRCKTFDSRADGFVPGEGCGIVVLKKLSDALADGDTIRAVIRGTAVNQDGRTTVLTAPNGLSQQAVIRNALANAQVAPSDVSYVEAHGTGTALGDPIEVEALSEVLAGDGAPCFLSSVKTNFGHLEAAAGVSGIIKAALSLEHEQIPKSLHFQKLNPHIQLGKRLRIADQAVCWPRGTVSRFAGVSSFGYGGTNAHVVLEEAPLYSVAQRASVTPHIWKRQRFWSVAKPATIEARNSVHPLLGYQLISPAIEGTVFENTLSADSPSFLGDHTPGGRRLFPLSAYVEMFLAASNVSAIEDVVVQESVELFPSKACQVQVVVRGEKLSLFSLDNGTWKLHASARKASVGQPSAPANIEELSRQPGQRTNAGEHYAALASRGLQFGPAFRLIESVSTNERGALAQIGKSGSTEGYRIHPAVLDACFQVFGALLPKDKSYLPLGLRRFELFRTPGSNGLWSRATVQPGAWNSFMGDLEILDTTGQLVASAKGLWMRSLDVADAEPRLCEIGWDNKPRAAMSQTPISGNWLVFADAGGVGLSIAAGLEAAGARCITVSRGEKFEELLRTVSLAGVIYLWPLDASSSSLDTYTLQREIRETCEPVLELVRGLAGKSGQPPQVWIVTRAAQSVDMHNDRTCLNQPPLWGLARTIRREHPELRCVTIDLDSQHISAERLLDEIRHPDGEEQIAWRGENRFTQRLVQLDIPVDSVRLMSNAPGRLEELQWKPFARRKPNRGEVEIRIAASGLNFRDVLNALGEYPGDAGPIGSECSGWIEEIGEDVSGLTVGQEVLAVARGSFGRFVTTKAD
ncbi:MAG TPA: beta-ketoacyl synthase N-terminal-like domain-containing protein, partial [Terriglobales bacterium]